MDTKARGNVNKDEILAILKANRDLGPLYDEHTADQILDLMQESKNDQASVPDHKVSRDPRLEGWQGRRNRPLGTIMPVLGISIPLLALAGGADHGLGTFAVLGLDAVVVVAAMVKR